MKIELLAPVGGAEALKAAVQNGADAVYMGAARFNARRSADNFDALNLEKAVEYCHERGVRVHVTLNTLVRQDEISAFEAEVRDVYRSGADAAIVQDFGAADIIRQIAPDMQMHASTQMAVHNAQGVKFVKSLGFSRAVLARELSFDEIAACSAQGLETEVFCHGALCVACSGQCLFSSLVGGRSGNRGMCAQPCRLKYQLADTQGYLLSPKDLMAIGNLDKLQKAGVSSLKIEGRLKRPEYVAVTTAAYRRALDRLCQTGKCGLSQEDVRDLTQMFNRGGFTQGYGPGFSEKELMFPHRPNHLGLAVGKSKAPGKITLDADISAKDSLVLRRSLQEDDIPVSISGEAGQTVGVKNTKNGDVLIRLTEDALMLRARETFRQENIRLAASAVLTAQVGKALSLDVWHDEFHAHCEGAIVEAARSAGTDVQRLKAQLNKTGDMPYRFESIEICADENAFVSVSQINALRREALEKISRARTAVCRSEIPLAPANVLPAQSQKTPKIKVQSAEVSQLLLAKQAGADEIVFAPRDLRPEKLEGAMQALKPHKFYLSLPPVCYERTLDALNAFANANSQYIKGVYISNIAQLGLAWPGELLGDHMLNAANLYTADVLSRHGIKIITPSVELTARQIENLPVEKELVVYGRIPLMYLRHCPNRAAQSMPGKHANCAFCDKNQPKTDDLFLTDRMNKRFPLRRIASPDGCVVQVLNADTLMLLKRAQKLPVSSAWRLLLDENDDAARVVRAHIACANMQYDDKLEDMADTTTGHYFRGVD